MYLTESNHRPPGDLQTLADRQLLGLPKALQCPSAHSGRSCDYFYFSPAGPEEVELPGETMVACDLDGNHPDGRNVLYMDGHVAWMSEAHFQVVLTEPQNAAFAAALKKVEGP